MELHTSAYAGSMDPVRIRFSPAPQRRNRLTTAFRPILAIPHLILVGGPIFLAASWHDADYGWGAESGVLGAVASICAFILWFAVIFTGHGPDGLSGLIAFYLRWRVRASAYVSLLRDEYPPFGDGDYPVALEIETLFGARNRLTVAFRVFLAIPHVIAICFIGFAWTFTTIIAWFAILITGHYPEGLYDFGMGALRWSTRVEAYMLLVHDEYPPFSLRA